MEFSNFESIMSELDFQEYFWKKLHQIEFGNMMNMKEFSLLYL